MMETWGFPVQPAADEHLAQQGAMQLSPRVPRAWFCMSTLSVHAANVPKVLPPQPGNEFLLLLFENDIK